MFPPFRVAIGLAVVAAVAFGVGAVHGQAAAPGTIDTVAGVGASTSDGIPAADASIPFAYGVAVDANGDLFISDGTHCTIRKVTAGIISTVAGNGVCGYSGDGGPATQATLSGRAALAFDAGGNLFIADTFNCAVRKVAAASGNIETVAGGRCGGRLDDGVAATETYMMNPLGVAVHPNGDLYIADSMACRVRRVSGGVITTVAGAPGADDCTFSGDGGPAANARLDHPEGIAFDAAGDLYIADNGNCRIRKISAGRADGIISTVAGNGTCYYNGDGPALTTRLNYPMGIAFDRDGGLLIADTINCLIRRMHNGTITTVAGFQATIGGDTLYTQCGYNGDGQPAFGAMVGAPIGVAADGGGNIYFSEIDSPNAATSSRVRIIHGGTINDPTTQTPTSAPTGAASATRTPSETVTPSGTTTPVSAESSTPSPGSTATPESTDTPTDPRAPMPSPTPPGDGRILVCHWLSAAPGGNHTLPGPEGGSYQIIVVDDDGADGNKALRAHADHEHDIIGEGEDCREDEPASSAVFGSPLILGVVIAAVVAFAFAGVGARRWRQSG